MDLTSPNLNENDAPDHQSVQPQPEASTDLATDGGKEVASEETEPLDRENVLELEAFIERKQWIQEQIKVRTWFSELAAILTSGHSSWNPSL